MPEDLIDSKENPDIKFLHLASLQEKYIHSGLI